eukprot:scaffold2140_cov394-Prasinococcus_capsulatus_cf.AAC.22
MAVVALPHPTRRRYCHAAHVLRPARTEAGSCVHSIVSDTTTSHIDRSIVIWRFHVENRRSLKEVRFARGLAGDDRQVAMAAGHP